MMLLDGAVTGLEHASHGGLFAAACVAATVLPTQSEGALSSLLIFWFLAKDTVPQGGAI